MIPCLASQPCFVGPCPARDSNASSPLLFRSAHGARAGAAQDSMGRESMEVSFRFLSCYPGLLLRNLN